jgi:hypothetical protein
VRTLRRPWCAALVGLILVSPGHATAELLLPPGFTAEVYVTGDGFAPDAWRGRRGVPSATTLAVDHAGTLYLARTGRRYNDVIRITGGFDRFVDQP